MGFQHVMPFLLRNNPEISSVQTGTATILTGTNSITDTITAVTKNKSFLVFSYEGSQGIDDSNFTCVRGQITNSTTLTFQTQGNITGTITVRWFVVEFSATSSASVQHGTLTMASEPSDDITISAITIANSFPIVSHSNNTLNVNNRNFFNLAFTSTTNLRVTNSGGGWDANVIDWQVVENPRWTVTKHTDTMTTGDSQEDLTISAITLADNWLRTSHNPSNNPDGNAHVRSYFSSTTNIRSDCQRVGGSDADWDLEYWVIDGGGDFVAQHDQNNTANATQDTTLGTVIDVNKTITHPTGGMNNYTQGQDSGTLRNINIIYPRMSIKDNNEITMDRGSNSNSIYYAFETVDFSNSM